MSTPPTVRKRPTQEQRETILRAYRRSQLSQREFAAQAGIGVSTLQLWLRKSATRSSGAETAFVQVPNLLGQAASPALYRLRLPGGIDLEMGSGFRTEELASLLQVLRSL